MKVNWDARRLPVDGVPRYRNAVDGFDLDMAFEPAEVIAVLERLFDKRGIHWVRVSVESDRHQFTLTLNDGARVQVDIRPLPAERMTYVGVFPRTLLEVHAGSQAHLRGLQRDIVLAFMRVTG
jgi:hypothetical protein